MCLTEAQWDKTCHRLLSPITACRIPPLSEGLGEAFITACHSLVAAGTVPLRGRQLFFTLTIFVGACCLLRRFTTVTTDCARLRKACPVTVSTCVAAGVPLSPSSQMLCTIGICASSGQSSSLARFLPPSFPKI